MDGRGRRVAGLLVCGALVAAGCAASGRQDGGRPLCEWLPTARSYARLGYRVLVFDFHDQDRVDDDVVAAVAELRRRGVARVVLVGSSMGGTAVLVAAARIRPAVAGVVSLSELAVLRDLDARTAVAPLRGFVTAHLGR